MRPKEEEAKVAREATGAFILSEKIDDSKSRKSEKEMKKELRRLARERIDQEKRERKAKERMAQLQHKQAKKGKVVCGGCGGKCAGEVLRVGARYFHAACFACRACSASLATGGFFAKDGHYYCPQDYQRAFGTRCAACRQYVEGEVVSALGNTYHQKCFTCARCKRAFPSGEKVTYTGSEVVCSVCVAAPERHTARARAAAADSQAARPPSATAAAATAATAATAAASPPPRSPQRNGSATAHADPNECAGCGEQLSEGQALVALERQWHPSCFACAACGRALQGEYMGRDGAPYCERDYQRLFGVRCAYCQRYIAGKVLQAGEQHHFHPTCARCSKCGDPFGDGEEMFLQGAAIWHPRCGPAPGDTNSLPRAASDLMWSMRSRTPSVTGSYGSPYSSLNRKWGGVSPGLTLREYGRDTASPARITAYSYLAGEPAYLRRPLPPRDQPVSPHFHRPPSSASTRASSRPGSKASAHPRPGMALLVDALRADTPRGPSPAPPNNEEPIELSHYPAAFKPPPGQPAKIERDDFPAPPYPYTDPERRRRWSDSYKGVPDSDEEAATGQVNGDVVDARLKREEAELAKIDTGIAQVFLKEVKEREKLQQWKKQNLDPRNASRTPNAAREAGSRLRYSSPVGASPSRNLHERDFPYGYGYNYNYPAHYHTNSLATNTNAPSYNGVSGGGGRAATLPADTSHHNHHHHNHHQHYHYRALSTEPRNGELTFSGLEHTHSTDFSSGKSDVSAGSITDVDRSAMTTGALGAGGGRGALGFGGASGGAAAGVRRSLPNMAAGHLLHQPAKLYPYHLLLISNYRLPPDADRLHLERHLADQEFEAILQLPRAEFYRLPQWRQNELKRRARLF